MLTFSPFPATFSSLRLILQLPGFQFNSTDNTKSAQKSFYSEKLTHVVFVVCRVGSLLIQLSAVPQGDPEVSGDYHLYPSTKETDSQALSQPLNQAPLAIPCMTLSKLLDLSRPPTCGWWHLPPSTAVGVLWTAHGTSQHMSGKLSLCLLSWGICFYTLAMKPSYSTSCFSKITKDAAIMELLNCSE